MNQLFYFMKFFAPRRSYTFLGLWTQKIWLFERFSGNICLPGTQNLTKIQNFDFEDIATYYTFHMTPRYPKNMVPGVSNQPKSKKYFFLEKSPDLPPILLFAIFLQSTQVDKRMVSLAQIGPQASN